MPHIRRRYMIVVDDDRCVEAARRLLRGESSIYRFEKECGKLVLSRDDIPLVTIVVAEKTYASLAGYRHYLARVHSMLKGEDGA